MSEQGRLMTARVKFTPDENKGNMSVESPLLHYYQNKVISNQNKVISK